MKLGKYISSIIGAILVFVIGWIIMGVMGGSPTDYAQWKGVISAVILFIFVIYFISVSIKMLTISIKRLLMFKDDKGIWKLLTLAFGIGMIVLAGLVAIFGLVWLIYALKDGITKTSFGLTDGFDGWCISNYTAANSFILGKGWAQFFTNDAPFGLFVTSFVFILIWAGAGITYEVIKKMLSQNPKYNNSSEEPKNDSINNNQN